MKILSIDFDIIMWPDLGAYNGLVGPAAISDLMHYYPLFSHIEPDLPTYEKITKFLTKVSKVLPADKITFIIDHEEIYKKCVKYKKTFELINIDYHHDIGYDDTDWNDILIRPNCSNWVKALWDTKKITSYTWVYHQDSGTDFPNDDVPPTYLTDSITIDDYDLDKLVNDIDELFICLSPEWIPEKYLPLFEVWKDILIKEE